MPSNSTISIIVVFVSPAASLLAAVFSGVIKRHANIATEDYKAKRESYRLCVKYSEPVLDAAIALNHQLHNILDGN